MPAPEANRSACSPLHTLIDGTAAACPDRPCLDFLGRRTSYAEVARLVDGTARGLQRLGLGKGERVGLCLPNCPHFVIAFFAALKAGCTVVPLDPLSAAPELAQQIADSGCRVVFTLDIAPLLSKVAGTAARIVACPMADSLPKGQALAYRFAHRHDTVPLPIDEGVLRFADLRADRGRPAAMAIDAADLAVLQYTGGTTGTPKAAMLTHGNLAANVAQVRSCFPEMAAGNERVLAVLPLSHVFAMTVAMNLAMACGALLILMPRFDMGQLLRTVARQRPTLLPAVPTLLRAIASAPGIDRHDLSSLKFCLSGGAPLPAEVHTAFERLTGCKVVEGYGLTEASPVVTCNPIAGGRAGTVGLPLPGTVIEIRSLTDPRRNTPPGQAGEVCVGGPQVMAGYWNRPEETAEAFVDGLLRTGDVGFVGEDGHLTLIDRIKDVILCSGYSVYPRAIEDTIHRHPAVAAATVIGIPDAYHGEVPKAFVQVKHGHQLQAETLAEFLRGRLSPVELPRHIEFRTELPKTAIGKLSRRHLRGEETARRAEGGGS